ncbi:MAG: hypothetical protein ACE14P_09175 [Methanotrichaceae archaeon]
MNIWTENAATYEDGAICLRPLKKTLGQNRTEVKRNSFEDALWI